MSGVRFLAQADCFFQTLLQPSSETNPVSLSEITLGSYPTANFWNSTEAENLWSLKVMPVQRQFTFYPRTQYDWINNRGHMYKNTTHQNIIRHYLQCIFLNCTAVMPPTLPLTFWCLSKFQFPFTWWWKIDFLLSSCIIHLSFYLLTKNCWHFNPLNPELNPICCLLALLAHHILHVSRIKVKSLNLRLLMSYIYGAPILDVSRSHTTTHHSR